MRIKVTYTKSQLNIPVSVNSAPLTAEELDEIIGKGEGDPDIHGYPGQETDHE